MTKLQTTTTPQLTQNPPRRRVQLTCPETSITDPDENRSFSMSSIKKRLDQGIVPQLTNDAFYSLEPLKYNNLQDALSFHQAVTDQFESLPASLRKLMGNNIHNFETFLNDPKNETTLIEYGLLRKRDATNQELVDAINKLNTPEPDPSTPPKAQK